MKRVVIGLLAAATLLGVAFAQTPVIPKVTSINSAKDLIQILPAGNPAVGNEYATVGQVVAGTTNGTGLNGYALPLTNFKTGAGVGMSASAGSGVFGVAITAGTSEDLIGEAANSNTKTDTAGIELVLPPTYVAGQNITITVNCNYTLGSGTIGTHTLAAHAYLASTAGAQAADIVATTAQSVPATAGTVSFTVTGASLVAGSRLWLTFVMVIQDTGASNITGQINSVSLS